MKIKNIILGILVIALASILIGSVSAVAPTGADKTITIDEDTTYTFEATDFGFADGDGHTLKTVDIVTVEANGDLELNGVDVTATQNISKADIDAGKLKFSPATNENGEPYTTFTFNVTDSNNEQSTTGPYTMTIDVTAVNDAPIFDWDISDWREGDTVSYDLNVEDVDNNIATELTKIVTGLPASLSIDTTGTWKLVGVLTNDDAGIYTSTLTMSDGENSVPKESAFQILDKYEDGQLEISDIDIENIDGDDDHIYPGNKVEITIDVDNDGNQDIEDITLYIYNNDLDIDEEYEFDLDENDDDEIIFEVQIPYDASEKKHDLDIHVKGKGDEDDNWHSDYYYDGSIEIDRGTNDIVISKLTITPTEAEAGDTITVKVEVTNIGSRDEEDVKIRIYNKDLDISKYSDEFDLDEDDDETETFEIEIPKDAESKIYNIEALISYDDDDKDEDDTPLSKTAELKVEGTAPRALFAEGAITSDALTAVTTTASGVRGTATKYELTLTNNEATTQTYEIKIMGVSDWATYMIEAGGESSMVSLPAGQSIPVYVYLTPKTAATTGQHTATVSAYSDDGMTDFEVLTTDVGGTTSTPVTGAATGITFAPTDLTTNWIIVAIVAMFGIAVAGYTVYMIKKD